MHWNSVSICILAHIGREEIGKCKEEPRPLKGFMNEVGQEIGTKSS